MNEIERRRMQNAVFVGWIAGACEGVGWGVLPWANPYVAMSLILGGCILWAVIWVALRAA